MLSGQMNSIILVEYSDRAGTFNKLRADMSQIYDVTVTIDGRTPIYKGDPGVEISSFKSFAAGGHSNVSQISMGVHTATHVDAPNHFVDGARRVHELDPQKLVGPCRVVEIDKSVVGIEQQHVG